MPKSSLNVSSFLCTNVANMFRVKFNSSNMTFRDKLDIYFCHDITSETRNLYSRMKERNEREPKRACEKKRDRYRWREKV